MVCFRKNLFIVWLLGHSLLSCGSLPKDRLVLAANTSDYAIFQVSDSLVHELLPKDFKLGKVALERFPYSQIHQQILFRFGNLHTKEYDILLEEAKAKQINDQLNEIHIKSPSLSYLIVWKEDDPLSPYTKILRTSQLLVTGEDQTMHLVHLELRANISFLSQYTFESWALLSSEPILPSIKPELKAKKGSFKMSLYHTETQGKKKVYGRWIVVGEESFLPKPLYTVMPTEEEIEDNLQKPNQTPSNRLEELESLKKKNLITEPEYKQKRQEILNSL